MKIFFKVIDDKHFLAKYYFCGIKVYTKSLHWQLYVQYRKFQDAARLGYKLLCFSDIKACKKASGELRKRQLSNIRVLEKFDTFAKENNIQYWLGFGSLLGAYRHGGFIPWDHDIDVCMFREDYLKVKKLIINFIESNSDYKYKRHCNKYSFVEHFSNSNFTEGIDFFLLEKLKTNLPCSEINKKATEARNILKKMDDEDKFTEENTDYIISNLIENKIKKSCQSEDGREVVFYLPTASAPNYGMCFELELLLPLSEITFEGKVYKSPKDTRAVLNRHYPNIDEYPPLMSDYEELNDRHYNSTEYPTGVKSTYSTDIDTTYQIK